MVKKPFFVGAGLAQTMQNFKTTATKWWMSCHFHASGQAVARLLKTSPAWGRRFMFLGLLSGNQNMAAQAWMFKNFESNTSRGKRTVSSFSCKTMLKTFHFWRNYNSNLQRLKRAFPQFRDFCMKYLQNLEAVRSKEARSVWKNKSIGIGVKSTKKELMALL